MGHYSEQYEAQEVYQQKQAAMRNAQKIADLRGGTLGGPSVPETGSKIRDGVGCIESQVAELQQVISAFEQRLDTVLTPCGPSVGTGTDKAGAAPANSHLFDRLGSLNDAVIEAKNRLSRILSRVEI